MHCLVKLAINKHKFIHHFSPSIPCIKSQINNDESSKLVSYDFVNQKEDIRNKSKQLLGFNPECLGF